MYNAVGIDVSKGKSTVAVLQPAGVIIRKPFNVNHTSSELDELAKYIGSLEGETRVVLECTGRYHEPVVKTLSEIIPILVSINSLTALSAMMAVKNGWIMLTHSGMWIVSAKLD